MPPRRRKKKRRRKRRKKSRLSELTSSRLPLSAAFFRV
jgi:uncharacterized protein YggL (DUF469 family)